MINYRKLLFLNLFEALSVNAHDGVYRQKRLVVLLFDYLRDERLFGFTRDDHQYIDVFLVVPSRAFDERDPAMYLISDTVGDGFSL